MTKSVFITITLFFLYLTSQAQYRKQQYFDGQDTTQFSLQIDLDSNSSNIWQIGKPQKTVFNKSATSPNCLVTDTTLPYPINNTSMASFSLKELKNVWGVLAIQWMQKIDLENKKDWAILEFSVDGGTKWENAFDNPYVYNFYGFNKQNVDTMPNKTIAFTGTDSTWRNVWFCFDRSWIGKIDSLTVRYTLKSDSNQTQQDGWMIDNMLSEVTIFHTINEEKMPEYMTISPNPSKGRVYINTEKINEFHIIEHMELINMEGRVVQTWKNIPTKFFIDIGQHPKGMYYLKAKTNKQTVAKKLLIEN